MSFSLLLQRLPPLVGRFVPFAAVVAANGINIPLIRQRELKYGIPVLDDDDNRVGTSKVSLEAASGTQRIIAYKGTYSISGQ